MRVRTPGSIKAATLAAASACLLAASASVTLGEVRTFDINAIGAQEVNSAGVPNQGDPDGSALGTITLDNGTGSGNTGSVTINLTVSNIDGSFSGHHIHQAPSTTTGPIVIDFGNPNTILTGTPTSGTLSGTITGLPAATITNVFAGPTGFYYNLPTTPNVPGGAVRHQLPEPGSAVLAGLGAAGLLTRRRRRAA